MIFDRRELFQLLNNGHGLVEYHICQWFKAQTLWKRISTQYSHHYHNSNDHALHIWSLCWIFKSFNKTKSRWDWRMGLTLNPQRLGIRNQHSNALKWQLTQKVQGWWNQIDSNQNFLGSHFPFLFSKLKYQMTLLTLHHLEMRHCDPNRWRNASNFTSLDHHGQCFHHEFLRLSSELQLKIWAFEWLFVSVCF